MVEVFAAFVIDAFFFSAAVVVEYWLVAAISFAGVPPSIEFTIVKLFLAVGLVGTMAVITVFDLLDRLFAAYAKMKRNLP
jgi:hypothetical protein